MGLGWIGRAGVVVVVLAGEVDVRPARPELGHGVACAARPGAVGGEAVGRWWAGDAVDEVGRVTLAERSRVGCDPSHRSAELVDVQFTGGWRSGGALVGVGECLDGRVGKVVEEGARGVPRVRSGRTASRPSSWGPAQHATRAATFVPCMSVDRPGAGWAVVRLTSVVSSSGAPTVASRQPARTCAACAPG